MYADFKKCADLNNFYRHFIETISNIYADLKNICRLKKYMPT